MTFAAEALILVFNATLYGSILALFVLLVLRIVERGVPARWRFALWLLVLIRLSMVPLPQSRLSMFNFVPGSSSPRSPSVDRSPPLAAAPAARPAFTGPDPTAPLAPAARQELAPLSSAGPIPAPARSSSAPFSILHFALSLLPAVYLAGLAAMLLHLLLATFALRRVVRKARLVEDPLLVSSLHAARTTLHIRRQLPLLLTDHLASPALVGLFKPRLLLPRHLLASCTSEDLRFIFLHECAHLRRRDVLLNYWLALVSALHWFNPIIWLIVPRIKADRELAADELVLLHAQSPAAYGHTLLKVLELSEKLSAFSLQTSAFCPPPAVAIIESNSKSFFKRRIQMIAAYRRTPAWFAIPATSVFLLLVAAALTGAITDAADSPGAKADPSTAATGADEELAMQIDLSPDALLNREIAKWKAYKQAIAGDTADDKLMRDGIDRISSYLQGYVGKPLPSNVGPAGTIEEQMQARRGAVGGGFPGRAGAGRAQGFPGADEIAARQAAEEADRNTVNLLYKHWDSAFSLRIEKQTVAATFRELQEKLYDRAKPVISVPLSPSDADPRRFLAEHYGYRTLHLDWKKLRAAGIQPDKVVSLDLISSGGDPVAAFASVLSKLKNPDATFQFSASGPFGESGIAITAVHLRVTYNVRDLLAPTNSAQANGRPISGNPDDLIKGVRLTCSPDWWKNAKEDSILQFKGLMTITTTPEIHDQIKGYLDTLRSEDKKDAAEGAAAGEKRGDDASKGNSLDSLAAFTQPASIAKVHEYALLGKGLRAGIYILAADETLRSALEKAGYEGHGQGMAVGLQRGKELTAFDLSKVMSEKDAQESKVHVLHSDVLQVGTTEEIDRLRQDHVAGAEFPHVVPFDVGESQFPAGDQITITDIRGTADSFLTGNAYQIKGTYTLASHDHVKLAAYVTSADPNDTHHDPYDNRQTILIDKGSGTFILVLPYLSKGYPHVSFYPADGGQSFSALYFGTGDSLLAAQAARP